jgi:hypothetical protein
LIDATSATSQRVSSTIEAVISVERACALTSCQRPSSESPIRSVREVSSGSTRAAAGLQRGGVHQPRDLERVLGRQQGQPHAEAVGEGGLLAAVELVVEGRRLRPLARERHVGIQQARQPVHLARPTLGLAQQRDRLLLADADHPADEIGLVHLHRAAQRLQGLGCTLVRIHRRLVRRHAPAITRAV